jgi:sec-independent protein translocase protein TatB
MFDLGWDEMAVIAVVALVVLGPKELPNALRTVMSLTKAARKLAGEFQSGVNEIVREADLEDTKKKLTELQSISKNSIQKAVEKAVDPTGEIKTAMKVEETPPAVAAAPKVEAVEAKPAEAPAAEPSTTEPSTTESSTAETAAQETTTEETAADKFETVEPAPQKDPAA